MGVPSDYGGLQGRWIAGAQLLNVDDEPVGDGDSIDSIEDQSGNARTLDQSRATKQPLWLGNQLNGHAAYYFDGQNDDVVSTALCSAFMTNSAFTFFVVARTLSLTTNGGVGQDRPGIWAGEAGAVGLCLNGSIEAPRAYHSDGSAPLSVDLASDSLVLGQAHIIAMRHDSGSCYISIDGGTESSFATGATSPAMNTAGNYLAFGRNYTGAAPNRHWHGLLFDAFVYDEARSAAEVLDLVAYLQQAYGLRPVPSLRDQVRTCASAKLVDNRVRQDALVDFGIPLWVALDNDPLDPAGFAHPDWPDPSGDGAGVIDWQRREMQFQSIEIEPLSRIAHATLYDLRRYVFTEMGLFVTGEAQSGGTLDGVAQLGQGPVRYFTRPSEAWVDSPAGDATVQRVDIGVMALADDGLLIQGQRTNCQLRSSLVSGLTGLPAITGDGVRALETSVLLFNADDAGAPANSLKITANGTISTEVDQPMPTTSAFGASDEVVVSIDVQNAAAAPGYVAIQRGAGDPWWDNATQTWSASKVWNSLGGDAGEWVRWKSEVMVPGAATLIVHVGIPTTGTPGQVNYYPHVQVEVGASATSRIVTDAAEVTRMADVYTIPNNADPGRALPAAPFTFLMDLNPEWGSADPSEHYVFDAPLDAFNWARLRWDGSDLLFELRAAGTTYTATYPSPSFTAGAGVSFAARACSALAEEDLAGYAISVFVDGVKGTDATAAAYSGGPAEATLFLGSDSSSAKQLDGSVRRFEIRPYAASDEEILAAASGADV